MKINQFEDCFEWDKIIRAAIRLRVKIMERRHEAHVLRTLSSAAADPNSSVSDPDAEVLAAFPPRRSWVRLNAKRRENVNRLGLAEKTLTHMILGMHRNGVLSQTTWGQNLVGICERVRQRVLIQSKDLVFEPPQVILIKKDGADKCPPSEIKYRPLAIFNRIEDRLIIGLSARYLQAVLEPQSSESSYAFRTRPNLNHHRAVERLIEYRQAQGEREVFVAECDIRCFFDGISHAVIRDRLLNLRKNTESAFVAGSGVAWDERLPQVVEAYLRAYSFPRNVLPVSMRKGKAVGWLQESERIQLHGSATETEIGIPQGGALSAHLANLMLNEADQGVEGVGGSGDPDLFYARYCDDMLVAHPERAACAAALERYGTAVARLRMAVHEPQTVHKNDDTYYNAMKSKAPYAWGKPGPDGRVPWVSFLGYQVRADGGLRIRLKSLKNEQHRIQKKLGQISRTLEATPTAGWIREPEEIVQAVNRQLAMHIAGKWSDRQNGPSGSKLFCWGRGFELLKRKPGQLSQLRAMDRFKEQRLRCFYVRLQSFMLRKDSKMVVRKKKKQHLAVLDERAEAPLPMNTMALLMEIMKQQKRFKAMSFFGAPWSYYGYFTTSNKRPDLGKIRIPFSEGYG